MKHGWDDIFAFSIQCCFGPGYHWSSIPCETTL